MPALVLRRRGARRRGRPGHDRRARSAARHAGTHERRTRRARHARQHRKAGLVRTEAFTGDVEGRIAIIIDDLIVTGTTLVRAAEACRMRGASAVHAMATHGVFTKATGGVLATPLIDSIVVTDTASPDRIDLGASRARLSIVSIAPLVARAITALHHERSMVQMAEEWAQALHDRTAAGAMAARFR